MNQTEETQLDRKKIHAENLASDIAEDLSLLSEQNGISLQITNRLPKQEIQVDSALLYRVLENILNNALRFAKEKIQLDFSLEDRKLTVIITDDGIGFPPDILNGSEKRLLAADKDGHLGIGLSVSRLLCKKHGGRLELSNTSGGACVKISISV